VSDVELALVLGVWVLFVAVVLTRWTYGPLRGGSATCGLFTSPEDNPRAGGRRRRGFGAFLQ
jgi:hypothetical protein